MTNSGANCAARPFTPLVATAERCSPQRNRTLAFSRHHRPAPPGRARPQRAWAGFPPRSDSSAVPGFRARCPGSRSDRVAARPGRRVRVPGTPLGVSGRGGNPAFTTCTTTARHPTDSPHPLRGGPAGGCLSLWPATNELVVRDVRGPVPTVRATNSIFEQSWGTGEHEFGRTGERVGAAATGSRC